jgi:hypothetical protein
MDVASGTQKNIEINGITVDLVVSSEGAELQAFPGVKLEHGAAYSALVLGTTDVPTVIWVQKPPQNNYNTATSCSDLPCFGLSTTSTS